MPDNTVWEFSVPMRDGVELYTTVQLPGGGGKFPLPQASRNTAAGLRFYFT